MPNVKTELRTASNIKPYENNPRHNDGAVDAVSTAAFAPSRTPAAAAEVQVQRVEGDVVPLSTCGG